MMMSATSAHVNEFSVTPTKTHIYTHTYTLFFNNNIIIIIIIDSSQFFFRRGGG